MTGSAPTDADQLVDPAIELAQRWLDAATDHHGAAEQRRTARLAGLITDPGGVGFTMRFVDRVARHRSDRLAARQLDALVRDRDLPRFLGAVDRALLRAGALVGRVLPGVVMPLARRRLRSVVGGLVVGAEPPPLHRHLADRHRQGLDLNVNILGEMVLGEEEAERRVAATHALIDDPAVDHVSVKVSGIASQLDLWSYDHTLDRIVERLRSVFHRATRSSPPTFVNLDMEEYRDLHLTIDAFMRVLDEPGLDHIEAGIALQAYLPDSGEALDRLTSWAATRHERSGAAIRIRLVKGANLAMERVDAELHGWRQVPYATKADVDANYARCLDRALTPERTGPVRIGVASHNLFTVAWAHLLAESRGVADRVEFEMLQGIAPGAARAVRDRTGSMLLYTPIVGRHDFDVAISYLFRRLEENAAPENFLRHLIALAPGSDVMRPMADAFRRSVARRHEVDQTPSRAIRPHRPDGFRNEPDSDPTDAGTRAWVDECRRRPPTPAATPLTTLDNDGIDGGGLGEIDQIVEGVRAAHRHWWGLGAGHRHEVLHRVADELARRRADLVGAMIHEARKLPAEADPEVSEAIDFARWYADRAAELERLEHAAFRPLGVVAVVPPWNFPVAIPAGGTLAALAAGNGVVLKPAPQTPRCAEIVAEACWAAGVGRHVLRLVRIPDDECGHRLVTEVDGVVFTGSWETATMFRRWRPDLPLFAETSGKNALVVTAQADQDLAASDLVRSAFGHSGQKCSAASLGILVGEIADDPRFIGKVLDAARTLRVGWPTEAGSTIGPLIEPARDPLHDALRRLQPGERWLLEPRQVGGGRNGRRGHGDGALWSPGIKTGVAPGSSFHLTECFGPVLGLMRARDLDEAIEFQNAPPYGLTGGIHSLDDDEVEHWLERVEVGNAYVNRHITGAIVRRQPFGGWKRSVIGPGAKTGGWDQLLQLGHITPIGASAADEPDRFLQTAAASDAHWMAVHYGREHDPTALFCEANALRYRTRPGTWIRATADAPAAAIGRAAAAASSSGATVGVSIHSARPDAERVLSGLAAHRGTIAAEDDDAFERRLHDARWGRVRLIAGATGRPAGLLEACHAAEVDLVAAPVTASGRLELRWYLREQSVSRTMHRFGNVVAR